MLKFYKYRTIGNDFIIIDNRDGSFDNLSDDTVFKRNLKKHSEISNFKNIFHNFFKNNFLKFSVQNMVAKMFSNSSKMSRRSFETV